MGGVGGGGEEVFSFLDESAEKEEKEQVEQVLEANYLSIVASKNVF